MRRTITSILTRLKTHSKMTQASLSGLLALSLLFSAQTSYSDWILDNDSSRVQFISTKNNSVTEIHQFDTVSGTITAKGKTSVTIDLSSVNTRIDIRDTRMKEHLFEVSQYTTAKIQASIDASALEDLLPGTEKIITQDFSLNLHGITKDIKADFSVIKLKNNHVKISTVSPIIINSTDFKLDGGIKKLQEIAKLSSIDLSVPVDISLEFKPTKE